MLDFSHSRSVVSLIHTHVDCSLIASIQIAEFPESEVAYVEWPFRGIISIMIGIHKAYPALKQDASQILGKPLQGRESKERERDEHTTGGFERLIGLMSIDWCRCFAPVLARRNPDQGRQTGRIDRGL